MLKECLKCASKMYPIKDDQTINSQSDESCEVHVWYCQICEDVLDMTEKEEIQALEIIKERR